MRRQFQPGGTLLDFGSGSGQAVAFARHLGWQAEGLEINANAVEAGKRAGVPVEQGSIDALENRPCRYEYIMSSHCVEHVPEVHRLFRAFFHALKPGGILALDVPNGDSTYLLSRLHSRGDCLIMTCRKPAVTKPLIPERPMIARLTKEQYS